MEKLYNEVVEVNPEFDPLLEMQSIIDIPTNSELNDPSSPYGKYNFVDQQKKRFREAAIAVINLMEITPNTPTLATVRFQVLKSSSSAAANYRAACRARSKKEFFSKMSIVVEETDETEFWLEILLESEIKINKSKVQTLLSEWTQLLKMMAKARSNIYK